MTTLAANANKCSRAALGMTTLAAKASRCAWAAQLRDWRAPELFMQQWLPRSAQSALAGRNGTHAAAGKGLAWSVGTMVLWRFAAASALSSR